MSQLHVFSLKRGTSHGLWQYKLRGTHDRIVLHGLHDVLDTTCRLIGCDSADRSAVYLFSFSAEPFPDCQVCLQKAKETVDGCYYRVTQSRVGRFEAVGLFPAFVNSTYLHAWPTRIYFKLERSLAGEIVN